MTIEKVDPDAEIEVATIIFAALFQDRLPIAFN
jgi:hypothetical protein